MRPLIFSLILLSLCCLTRPGSAYAQDGKYRIPTGYQHALGFAAPPKYDENFQRFSWAQPRLQSKGGLLRLPDFSKPSSEEHPAKISGPGRHLPFDTLAFENLEEPGTFYGLLAEKMALSADFKSIIFRLRSVARFANGQPVTAKAVADSLNVASQSFSIRRFASMHVLSDRELRVTYGAPITVQTMRSIAEAPIALQTQRGVVGSGPYIVASSPPGRRRYLRRKDYWADDLPVARGQWQFDGIEYVHVDQRTNTSEQLLGKALVDVVAVPSAREWALSTPQLKSQGVAQHSVSLSRRPALFSSLIFNTRRSPFNDARVREAFHILFDFGWTRRSLLFDQYGRLNSYFEGTESAATGKPDATEAATLRQLGPSVPPRALSSSWEDYVQANDGAKQNRALLRKAVSLMAQAGWALRDGKMHDQNGRPLSLTVLVPNSASVRLLAPYAETLRRIGIDAKIAAGKAGGADSYFTLLRGAKFDAALGSFRYAAYNDGSEELERLFGTRSSKGSCVTFTCNWAGVSDAAIDRLATTYKATSDPVEKIRLRRVLDRLLKWGFYQIPLWYKNQANLAALDLYHVPREASSLGYEPERTWSIAQTNSAIARDVLVSRERSDPKGWVSKIASEAATEKTRSTAVIAPFLESLTKHEREYMSGDLTPFEASVVATVISQAATSNHESDPRCGRPQCVMIDKLVEAYRAGTMSFYRCYTPFANNVSWQCRGVAHQPPARREAFPKNPRRAEFWIKYAAARKSLKHTVLYKDLLLRGGPNMDDALINANLRLFAKKGNAKAAFELGMLLAWRPALRKSPGEWHDWLTKAARLRHAGAALALGTSAEAGRGRARDLSEAYKWYLVEAQLKGSRDSATAARFATSLERKLTWRQIVDGRRQATIYRVIWLAEQSEAAFRKYFVFGTRPLIASMVGTKYDRDAWRLSDRKAKPSATQLEFRQRCLDKHLPTAQAALSGVPILASDRQLDAAAIAATSGTSDGDALSNVMADCAVALIKSGREQEANRLLLFAYALGHSAPHNTKRYVNARWACPYLGNEAQISQSKSSEAAKRLLLASNRSWEMWFVRCFEKTDKFAVDSKRFAETPSDEKYFAALVSIVYQKRKAGLPIE